MNSESSRNRPDHVKYIAHRGLSAHAPENTLPAFLLAAGKKGFYGIEFDLWESRVEKSAPLFLVMHDPTTKRMCGKSMKVRNIGRKDRKEYEIVSGNNVKEYENLTIPTADQVLEIIWKESEGAIPVIELKHRLSRRGLGYLMDMIGDRNVVIISFELKAVTDAVKMARKRGVDGNITTMLLAEDLPRKRYKSTIRKLKRCRIDCISLKYRLIDRQTVNVFHKAGLKVGAWTLPNKKTADKYIDLGVDYITSNGVVY